MSPNDRVKRGDDIVDGTTPRHAVGERAGLPGAQCTRTATGYGGGASVGGAGGPVFTRRRRWPSEPRMPSPWRTKDSSTGVGVPLDRGGGSMTPEELLPDASAAHATHHGSHGESAAHERWFRTLVANSSDLIAVLDDHARVLYANPSAERMLGFIPAERVGRGTFKLIHPDDRDAITTVFREGTHQPGIHRSVVFRFKTASGDWRTLEAVATNCLGDPAIAGIVVNARDVTDQTNLSRALRTLTQGNQVVVRATNEASLLADACETIVAAGYLLAWVGYAEHDSAHTLRPLASAGRTEYLKRIRVSWGEDQLGSGPTGTAIRTRSVQVLTDMHRSPQFAPWRVAADQYGFRTSCALPLIVGDDAIGALTIYAGEVGAFDAAAVAALTELAADLAYGIGRLRDAERLARSEALLREANDELRLKTDEARASLEKLRISDQQRRRLLGGIVSAQEAERRRVAADIHDNFDSDACRRGHTLGLDS